MGAVHEGAKVLQVTGEEMGGSAGLRGLEDDRILCGEPIRERSGPVRSDQSDPTEQRRKTREKVRILGREIPLCLLAGGFASEEGEVSGPAQFDEERRFSAGILGGGKKYISVEKDAHYFRAARRFRTRFRSASSRRSALSHADT